MNFLIADSPSKEKMLYSSLPALYVHIPFCPARCGYCSFVSSVYDPAVADDYLSALENEWTNRKNQFLESPGSIYIGGGTPSALSLPQLTRLMKFLPSTPGEATCELNPETASHEKLSLLFDSGITRLSFGVQTFSPAGLRILGRYHREGDVERAVGAALRLGFRSISVDLIHSWPGQTVKDIGDDIRKSAALTVQHISNYALTLEPSARSYRRLKRLLPERDDSAERALWDYTEAELARHGFRHYETSNFARPGFICRHNAAIWQGGEYLGLGAGAHSHWAGRRFANTSVLAEYIRRAGVGAEVFSEKLEGLEKARETAVFWLRLFDGIGLAAYRERTGYDFREVYPVLPQGVEVDAHRVWVPAPLQPVLDAILVDMV